MFYNNIKLPIILEINKEIVNSLNDILSTHNLYFKNKLILTSKEIYSLFKNVIDFSRYDVLYVNNCEMQEIKEILKIKVPNNTLVIGFGGGKVIDVVKYFCTIKKLCYLSMPTTLSNDGIYSPVARINVDGKHESFGVDTPLGIIIDLNIVSTSPKINLLAGIGDLLSNISALDDWKLAKQDRCELINDFAYTLSYLATQSILDHNYNDIYQEEFLKKLSYGLILSGLAMEISGDTRPSSGAEHMISHAIDKLYPERATLHGLQVAFGCLLIEKIFRKKRYNFYQEQFEKVGLLDEINQRINYSEEEISNIIKTARSVRDRYTILAKLS